MNCFVCGGEMHPFFEKNFSMAKLQKCEYVRCENCGLVVAKTLYEMPHDNWIMLNYECHDKFFKGELDDMKIDPKARQRIEYQSELFEDMINHGIFKINWRTLDYGAGNGLLSDKINEKLQRNWLKKFEAYVTSEGKDYLSPEEVLPASFDFVVTTAVFEHLLGNKGDVEKIIDLLNSNGVMALHTLICEEVPQDPNWFYLLPIHCTFWTNKAMSIIYEKNNFIGCAYNREAQMWLMFRRAEDFLRLESCQKKLRGNWTLSEKFVDYWKTKPYRNIS